METLSKEAFKLRSDVFNKFDLFQYSSRLSQDLFMETLPSEDVQSSSKQGERHHTRPNLR